MGNSLPFEYAPRVSELVPQLLSGEQGTISRALSALEDRDRALEDYLKSHQGGGTSQSILSWAGDSAFHDDDPSSGTTYNHTNLAFSVPSDTSFDYYLDWFINGKLLTNGTLAIAVCSGYAKIQEQLPGVGYEETFGFVTVDTAPAGVAYYASGVGHRMEKVSSPLLGTTIHLDVTFVTQVSVAQRLRSHQEWEAKLIAIPS